MKRQESQLPIKGYVIRFINGYIVRNTLGRNKRESLMRFTGECFALDISDAECDEALREEDDGAEFEKVTLIKGW